MCEINQIVLSVGHVILRHYGPKAPCLSLDRHLSQFVALLRTVAAMRSEIFVKLIFNKYRFVDYIAAKSACHFKQLLHLFGRKVIFFAIRSGLQRNRKMPEGRGIAESIPAHPLSKSATALLRQG
jgi:hypothetical protein